MPLRYWHVLLDKYYIQIGITSRGWSRLLFWVGHWFGRCTYGLTFYIKFVSNDKSLLTKITAERVH